MKAKELAEKLLEYPDCNVGFYFLDKLQNDVVYRDFSDIYVDEVLMNVIYLSGEEQ